MALVRSQGVDRLPVWQGGEQEEDEVEGQGGDDVM